MDVRRLRAARLSAQLLAGPPAGGVLEVVERLVGVQAQATPAARLAVRVRTSGLTAADVDRAVAAGEVVRTWLMRGTLHMVATADLGWLTALLAPRFRAAGRRRREQLGLDEDTCERALPSIEAALADGPLSRAELVDRLAGRGIPLDPGSQAPAHLVAYAALSGLVCRGPDLAGDEPSIGLVAQLARGVPQRRFDGDEALRELARRYLAGHGPADAADLAAWSGLPVGTARRAFALLSDPPPDNAPLDNAPLGGPPMPPPRLLGPFDPVLLGHRDRGFVLPARHARRVNAGGGMIAATVLVDGKVAGVWRRAGRVVTVTAFGRARLARRLQDEAADLGRFLGAPLTVRDGEG